MNERAFERWASLSGLVLAVLLTVRTLITPQIPFIYGENGVEIWFRQNHILWVVTVWMTIFIVIAGTWFVGGLRAYLARQGASRLGTIALIGWSMVGTLALARHALLAMPALVGYTLFEMPGMALFLAQVAGVMLGMVWGAAVIVTIAVGMAGIQSGKLPNWFSWFSLLEGVLLLAGSLATVQVDGFFSSTGPYRYVALWSYILWNAAGSLVLYRLLKKE